MYRSVVWKEACPSKNRICSSSPLQSWQSRAHVRRRSWGARLGMPACRAHRFTAYQTTFAVTPASCRLPTFESLLNTRPSLTAECGRRFGSHLSEMKTMRPSGFRKPWAFMRTYLCCHPYRSVHALGFRYFRQIFDLDWSTLSEAFCPHTASYLRYSALAQGGRICNRTTNNPKILT
jgi:hypothetical protein